MIVCLVLVLELKLILHLFSPFLQYDVFLASAVSIDDPLLQSAYEMSKLCTPVPRPWDGLAWSAFVKEKQAEGTLDIRTQLENLALQLKGMKVRNTVQVKAQKALQQKSGYNYKTADMKSPEKPTPVPKERLLVDTVTKSDKYGGFGGSLKKSTKGEETLRAVYLFCVLTRVLFPCMNCAVTAVLNGKNSDSVRVIVEPVYRTANDTFSDNAVSKSQTVTFQQNNKHGKEVSSSNTIHLCLFL